MPFVLHIVLLNANLKSSGANDSSRGGHVLRVQSHRGTWLGRCAIRRRSSAYTAEDHANRPQAPSPAFPPGQPAPNRWRVLLAGQISIASGLLSPSLESICHLRATLALVRQLGHE